MTQLWLHKCFFFFFLGCHDTNLVAKLKLEYGPVDMGQAREVKVKLQFVGEEVSDQWAACGPGSSGVVVVVVLLDLE